MEKRPTAKQLISFLRTFNVILKKYWLKKRHTEYSTGSVLCSDLFFIVAPVALTQYRRLNFPLEALHPSNVF